ncbi:MAG: ABC transporter substrate-binding protein [Methanothrix sp.]|nr:MULTISPECIES: ABC transporter substrate-binding protein [Methanothrix]MBC7080219.1 ABC transporter substrate-binding protein [Methanothrix sp.]NPU87387.1 ABC transporter substrate-binding protein [Methanothrix sp.]
MNIGLFIGVASGDGSTAALLSIFGNANMDDKIDEMDVAYVQGIIDGKMEPTMLSDANCDGKIDFEDIDQINALIKDEAKFLIVVDSVGRNVTIKLPINKLIALGSYRIEAVKILNAENKVVGISSDIPDKNYYYPELIEKPLVGTWSSPDSETIVALSPDIVITSANLQRATNLENALKYANIPVIGLDFYRDDIIKSEIRTLGFILNKDDEAERYIKWRRGYEQTITDYVAKLEDNDKPHVFMEWGTKNTASEISSYGRGSSGDAVCRFTGGINIAADLPEYPKVDSEWVLATNPDIIIRMLAPGGEKPGWNNTEETASILKNYIESRPGWTNLEAVKNNRVHLLSTEIAWGPDSIVGVAYFAKWLHPSIDIDPMKIYMEYLEDFMDLRYSEEDIGVLGYPTK